MSDFNQFRLDNNIEVVHIPNSSNITAIQIFIKVGSINENIDEKGMSHFLEHMLFKGTKKRNNPKAIAKELDSVGGYFNAYTDKDVTCYIVKINSDHIKIALDILSDMLCNSIFNNEEFEMERNVVVEEINKDKDDFGRQVIENLYEIIFENNPLMYSIGAEEEDIRNFTRENVIKYWKKHYCSNKTYISICTNKTKIETQNLLNIFFKNFKPCQDIDILKQTKLNLQTEPRYNLQINKNLEQVYLALGFPLCDRYNNDKYTLEIINILLAGNMSSRLFTSLREKNGLSYNISCDIGLYKDTGIMYISTSFDKDSLILKNINDIKQQKNFNELYESIFNNDSNKFGPGGLPIIIHELHKLKTELVDEEELSKVKGYLQGNLILKTESSNNLSEIYGRQLLEQYSITSQKKILEKYNGIESEDIRNISKKYFDFKKLNISIIGDYQESYIKSFIDYYIFNKI